MEMTVKVGTHKSQVKTKTSTLAGIYIYHLQLQHTRQGKNITKAYIKSIRIVEGKKPQTPENQEK